VETNAALLGTDGIAVLDTVAVVRADIAIIFYRANAEADDTVGL